jgi:EAL domain-containing protein (putative c-di-GMP-specific phosphodiesterase class I)
MLLFRPIFCTSGPNFRNFEVVPRSDTFSDEIVRRACAELAVWSLASNVRRQLTLNVPLNYAADPRTAAKLSFALALNALQPSQIRLQLRTIDYLGASERELNGLMDVRSMGVRLSLNGVPGLDIVDYLAHAAFVPDIIRVERRYTRLLELTHSDGFEELKAAAYDRGVALAATGLPSMQACRAGTRHGFAELQGPFFGDAIASKTVAGLYVSP